MSKNSSEKDLFLSIDQDLKDIASDIPDMPDSFRSGWRRAIRAEAEKNPKIQEFRTSESTLPPEKAPNKKSLRHSRRWTYFLSAAAVLIFLFSGTLATRGMLSPRLKEKVLETGASVLSAEEEKSSPATTGSIQQTGSASRNNSCEEDAAFGSQYAAEEESSVSWLSMESAEEESEDYPEEKSFSVSTYASAIRSDSLVPDESDRSSDSFPDEDAVVGTDGAGEAPTASPPAKATVSPAVSSPPVSEQPPAAESTGTRIVWFFEDMGAFILAALPYMAAAGILLLIIILIKHKKK